jgi:anti-sigma-K factor RskA
MASEHDRLEALIAPYVLGAADDAEADVARSHLAECDQCQALASRLTRAAGALPLALEPVEPGAELRARILAAATHERPHPGRVQSRHARVRWWVGPSRRRWAQALAAAAAVFLIGILVGFGIANRTPPAPAAVSYSLVGTGGMAGSRGRAVDLRTEHVTVISFEGLPALEQDRVYELWLIGSDGRPVSGGVFRSAADSSGYIVVKRDLDGVKTLAVTNESGPNGAPAPTQQPELIGSVA